MLNYPRIFFLFSLLVLWLSAQIGLYVRRRWALKDDEREDFSVVQTATLTLLGLIIGFSFSMAISRYDLRKNYEEAEANAIGTEYVRAELLPAADAPAVRSQVRKYLDWRITFYRTRDVSELRQINADLLVRNMSGQNCCPPPMRPQCVPSSESISTCVSRSTAPAMRASFARSMPIPLNCRRRCGPRYRFQPWRNQHPSSPSRL